ncbi:FG-GAP repeat domain-containing protein [Parafilimonas terrae]|uniref:Repeat domain-containing protein n=1 Tax=Parafilimonas terrae TaxID=1465490 RepID=A0A1I5RTF6_9BACT|nr:VCBS repeat-containing protein [Parafilimonas terrae]SFP61670.1 Repeat domain-containing protein [Parafilimonas terrae]
MKRTSVLVFIGYLFFISCSQPAFVKNKTHASTPDSSIKKGKILAETFCQSCHSLPDPSLLTAGVWENGVLPAMGPRLGIFEHRYKRYPSNINDPNIGRHYYPPSPLLSNIDWQHIIDYYTALSPDTIALQKRKIPIKTSDALFKAKAPALHTANATTCLVTVDTTEKSIYTSDILNGALYKYNTSLEMIDSLQTGGGIVQLLQAGRQKIACNIGMFPPNNLEAGSIQSILSNNKRMKDSVMYKKLMRPVNISTADLNNDGLQDFVVCEFGYLKGALSWLQHNSNNSYTRHVIKDLPGAIKSVTGDFNNDGKPDIMALFAQGEEGIFLFTNKGDTTFDEEEILRFPPSYGSSYFELDDFNKDGYPDILYTCGDNADYSPELKPYHGVYIFLNDKSNHFKQSYFFHIDGCYKAIAKDFDNDGDLDIATIAFFADYTNEPGEGFVYLKHIGGNNFEPYSLPETENGRWLTMEAADIDKDGRSDLILGNCSVGPTITKSKIDFKQQPPFLLLKNIQ